MSLTVSRSTIVVQPGPSAGRTTRLERLGFFRVGPHRVKLLNLRHENFWSLNFFIISFFAGMFREVCLVTLQTIG
jgi:hypothetical protein